MHKRAPPSDDRNAKRQRAYRQRVARHQIAVVVPVDEAIINFLVRTGWLAERDSDNRAKIADSISRMIAEAEQHRCYT